MLAGLLLLLFAAPGELRAYVDPGTGTMLVQVVTAFVIGILFQFRRLNPLPWVRGQIRKLSTKSIRRA